MKITATEFKTNFGKYLKMISLSQEDIFITNEKSINIFVKLHKIN